MKLFTTSGIILLLLLLLLSKYSLSQTHGIVKLTDSTLSELNGKYLIQSTDSSALLPSCLINNFHFNWEYRADSSDYIKIEVINLRKVRINLYDNEKLVKSETIRGKVKNGSFVANPLFIDPFYFVLFGTAKYRLKIGLTTYDSLLVDGTRKSCAYFLFMPIAGDSIQFNEVKFDRHDDSL